MTAVHPGLTDGQPTAAAPWAPSLPAAAPAEPAAPRGTLPGADQPAGVLAAAERRASTAAAVAGVAVRPLASAASAHQAADLLSAVWGGGGPTPDLVVALAHAGGYAAGAYDPGGVLLAVSLGFRSADGLHSHITGVLPGGQRRGLGSALKLHQRAWALDRGLTVITWTCDPLVRRNVTFNLHALGASLEAYLPDHYGPMQDAINTGDPTDRVWWRWDLVGAAADAPAAPAAAARLPFVPATGALLVGVDPRGGPCTAGGPDPAALPGPVRVTLPADIEALRRSAPALARAWRYAVRDALLPALQAGARVSGLTADGALVLTPADGDRPAATAGAAGAAGVAGVAG